MTEYERELVVGYVRERAASVADACNALGCPEHISSFIRDGYDAAGVFKAMEGAASLQPTRATKQRLSAPRDVNAELEQAVAERTRQIESGYDKRA